MPAKVNYMASQNSIKTINSQESFLTTLGTMPTILKPKNQHVEAIVKGRMVKAHKMEIHKFRSLKHPLLKL